MLMFAMFVFFMGCTKDDNQFREVGSVEELYSFEALDAWLGAGKDDVLNNLSQLGFIEDSELGYSNGGFDNTVCILPSENAVEYEIVLTTKGGTVESIMMHKREPATSYENFIATIDGYVQQARRFYADYEIVMGSGYFTWDDTPNDPNDGYDNGIDGDAEFTSYDEFLTALSGSEHACLEMISWADMYSNNRSAGVVFCFYDVLQHNEQGIGLAVGQASPEK